MSKLLKFPIEDSSHIGEIRRSIKAWALDLGFSETIAGKMAIVINELGTNIIKHAQRGEMIAQIFNSHIFILAIDNGPGMSNIKACMDDGFSTQGTAGNGLGAIRRLSDIFDAFTLLGKGTIVLAGFKISEEFVFDESPWDFYGFSLPIKGETVSGDGWSCAKSPSGKRKVLVSDGLGHGILAHEATNTALDAFKESVQESPLVDIKHFHHALRSSRGAALSEGIIDAEKMTFQFCGIGNVIGAIVSPASTKRMISYNGTAGVQLIKIQELTYPLEKESLIIIHSDGLSSQWSLSPYPGIFLRHPLIIAGLLYRDFNRGTDDVTVIVAKEFP